jgi:hypothetical protein
VEERKPVIVSDLVMALTLSPQRPRNHWASPRTDPDICPG